LWRFSARGFKFKLETSNCCFNFPMAAVCRHMRQLSGLRALGLSRISPSSSSFQTSTIFDPYFSPSLSTTRSFSQLVKSNGKHLFLVDTLALVIPLFPF
jgi:hypothetical protein